MKKYYILRIDSYSGKQSFLLCNSGSENFMYAVLLVDEENAEIIDMGYSSKAKLVEAWNNVHFVNLEAIS